MPVRSAYVIERGLSPAIAARPRARRRSSAGGALIEMIGILPLMVLFMLMTILVCRWLVFQGRILAAERTASWLVAHADDPKKAGTDVQGAGFAGQLRDWHFVNGGVVMVRAPIMTDGVLSSGTVQSLMDQMKRIGMDESGSGANDKIYNNTAMEESRVVPIMNEENKRIATNETVFAQAGAVVGSFMAGVLQFLTRDFQRTEVQVSYWMPSPFRMAAFERLAGSTVGRGSGGAGIPGDRTSEFQAGRDYLLLSRGEHTVCVMPVLDPGKDGGVGKAIGEVITQVDSVMDKVRDALKRSSSSDLYRPMVKYGTLASGSKSAPAEYDSAADDAVVQDAFYALLMYEWLDPKHDNAQPVTWPSWLVDFFGD